MAITWAIFSLGLPVAVLLVSRFGVPGREKEETIGGCRVGKVWEAFFCACREQGVLEVQGGRLAFDEVEAADPRVMLALPSIVVLRCLISEHSAAGGGGGAGRQSVVLSGGTEITAENVAAIDAAGRKKPSANARVFGRLLVAHQELKLLGELTKEERKFLELRALQADAAPLGDAARSAAVNRAAASVSAVATEVSQLRVFSRMGRVIEEIQKRVNTGQGNTDVLFPPPLAEEGPLQEEAVAG